MTSETLATYSNKEVIAVNQARFVFSARLGARFLTYKVGPLITVRSDIGL